MQTPRYFPLFLSWWEFSIPWLSWLYCSPFGLVLFQLLLLESGSLLYWSHISISWNTNCVFPIFSRNKSFILPVHPLFLLGLQSHPYNSWVHLHATVLGICCLSSIEKFLASCTIQSISLEVWIGLYLSKRLPSIHLSFWFVYYCTSRLDPIYWNIVSLLIC